MHEIRKHGFSLGSFSLPIFFLLREHLYYHFGLNMILSFIPIFYIGSQIRDVTTNVTLGIGVFNEKLLQPFAPESIVPNTPPDPDSFAFRHVVQLTTNESEFTVSVFVSVCFSS